MGEAIAVIPSIVVMIARLLGRELLQRRLQVRDRARLEFDGRDAGAVDPGFAMQTIPVLTADFSTSAATWAVTSITSPKPWVETSNVAL